MGKHQKKFIKDLCSNQDISPYRLGKMTKISPQHIHNICQKKAVITPRLAKKILVAFPDLKIEDVMTPVMEDYEMEYKRELHARLYQKY